MLPVPVTAGLPTVDVAGPGPGAVPDALPPDQLPIPGPAVNPPVQTAAPVPGLPGSAPVPAAPDPIAVARQNLLDTQQLNTDIEQNRAERDKLQSDLAAKQAANEARKAQALSDFLAKQQVHRQEADADIQAKRRAYEGQQFHSLWSTRTTGQKVGIALGVLAGGIGWDSNHVNRGLQMLQESEQEDFARQKEKHADLWRDLQLSLDGRKELGPEQLHELADWQTLEGAKWSAIASRLNGAIALNKGRGESLEAKKAAIEATEKANTAWQNAVQAKATAKHMEAQTRLTNEEVKNQPGIRDLHKAETEKAYADAANARAMAANGGMDKFTQQLLTRIPTQLQRDPDVKALYGSDNAPGPLRVLPRISELQASIKDAVSRGDTQATVVAVTGAREQLAKLLSGVSPTKTSTGLIEELRGSEDDVRRKLGKIFSNPQEGEKFVHTVYQFLDDAREQNLKVADAARDRLRKRHLSPKNPLTRNPIVKDELENQLDSMTGGVSNADGSPRYGEGGAKPAPAPTSSAPAPKMITIKNKRTGESKTVTEDEARKLGAIQ